MSKCFNADLSFTYIYSSSNKSSSVPSADASLLALLVLVLTQGVVFLTGDRDAGDKGHELFKVQLVVFVVVQILDDLFHRVWALLVLKQTRVKLKTNIWPVRQTADAGILLSGRWAAPSPPVSSAPSCSRCFYSRPPWRNGGRPRSGTPWLSPDQSWLQ